MRQWNNFVPDNVFEFESLLRSSKVYHLFEVWTKRWHAKKNWSIFVMNLHKFWIGVESFVVNQSREPRACWKKSNLFFFKEFSPFAEKRKKTCGRSFNNRSEHLEGIYRDLEKEKRTRWIS